MDPQLSPRAAQVVGVHPQTLGLPVPPQVWGAVQVPQLSVPPHPSGMDPQLSPRAAQVVGVHPQTLGLPLPPQVWGAVQVPQLSVPPHPSEIDPQLSPRAAHVVGVHPQTLGLPPPPQVWGAVHIPQLSVPPHPSEIDPQLSPRAAHVVGVQSQVPLMHVFGGVHVLPGQQGCRCAPQLEHVSSVVADVDLVHVPLVHSELLVHSTQKPALMFVASVSQYGVAPLHPYPLSAQVQRRQLGGVLAATHSPGSGAVEMQDMLRLLHKVCTTQVPPSDRGIVPSTEQMSPISPQLVSYHAMGRAIAGMSPTSRSVIASAISCECTDVTRSR
jgi:hypothetical protein